MADYSTDPQVVRYLLDEDAGEAMDWLIKVFGFTERTRNRHGDGSVQHGELQAAGADVSAICRRENRASSYTVDDPEGHRWYFSEPL